MGGWPRGPPRRQAEGTPLPPPAAAPSWRGVPRPERRWSRQWRVPPGRRLPRAARCARSCGRPACTRANASTRVRRGFGYSGPVKATPAPAAPPRGSSLRTDPWDRGGRRRPPAAQAPHRPGRVCHMRGARGGATREVGSRPDERPRGSAHPGRLLAPGWRPAAVPADVHDVHGPVGPATTAAGGAGLAGPPDPARPGPGLGAHLVVQSGRGFRPSGAGPGTAAARRPEHLAVLGVAALVRGGVGLRRGPRRPPHGPGQPHHRRPRLRRAVCAADLRRLAAAAARPPGQATRRGRPGPRRLLGLGRRAADRAGLLHRTRPRRAAPGQRQRLPAGLAQRLAAAGRRDAGRAPRRGQHPTHWRLGGPGTGPGPAAPLAAPGPDGLRRLLGTDLGHGPSLRHAGDGHVHRPQHRPPGRRPGLVRLARTGTGLWRHAAPDRHRAGPSGRPPRAPAPREGREPLRVRPLPAPDRRLTPTRWWRGACW